MEDREEQEKQLDLKESLGYLHIPLYGGHGEAVNTYDCDSYIRGFDPLWPPQKNQPLAPQTVRLPGSKGFLLIANG